MTRTRYKIYNNQQPHFLTMTVVHLVPKREFGNKMKRYHSNNAGRVIVDQVNSTERYLDAALFDEIQWVI